MRWPTFLLSLALPAVSLANGAFENSAIVRTVDLGGALVHVTTTYAVKALQPNQKVYTVLLGPDEKLKTSWLEVTVKGQKKPLVIEESWLEADPAHFVGIQLPKALPTNGVVNLVVETVQTRATSAWPETAAQGEDQLLRYKTSLFVLSPYHTTIQRTKIKAPTPRIPSFTTPENLGEFTDLATVSKSGATLTYGPYNNIAPTTEEFLSEHQRSIEVQYAYDRPVLEVTQLKRAAEISHWGSNLNIQDEIHLHNGGPTLKGHFSRLAHQQQNFHKRPGPQVLSSLTLHLPAGIRNTYYYDLIGNVSTSRLRTAPSGSLLDNQYSVLDLKPRYPVLGGWNYSFTLGWDAPLEDSATYDKSTGRYYVKVPIMTLLPGAVVNEAELKIIMPEGATDVEVYPPFAGTSNTLSNHVTYLDTTGRPQVTIEYQQLTDRHAGFVYVSYRVPFTSHLKKPVAVGVVFFGMFVLAIAVRRVDLRIHKQKAL